MIQRWFLFLFTHRGRRYWSGYWSGPGFGTDLAVVVNIALVYHGSIFFILKVAAVCEVGTCLVGEGSLVDYSVWEPVGISVAVGSRVKEIFFVDYCPSVEHSPM